jgi:hypothetical protein
MASSIPRIQSALNFFVSAILVCLGAKATELCVVLKHLHSATFFEGLIISIAGHSGRAV